MMDKETKILLANIVDKCDNSLSHIPSKYPKHRKYFDLFKHLANIATLIAGEKDVLWWKEYTNGRVNYDKVYYNVKVIREALSLLPGEIREKIEESIKSHPATDFLLAEYENEDLMRKIAEEFSEEKRVSEEKIFWEYEIRKEDNKIYLYLYPKKEWGLTAYGETITYKASEYKIRLSKSSIAEKLESTVKSLVDYLPDSRYNEFVLIFEDNPNIPQDIKTAILKINEILAEEREKIEKIEKELEGIATPKTE
ncbi:hypothetical protein [Pyrococcus abyssi]|nr:hypothetical protein [Pyrococcus abyssi]